VFFYGKKATRQIKGTFIIMQQPQTSAEPTE